MSFFARVLGALHESRRRKAERVIRQSRRLVEEAREYELRRTMRMAHKAAGAETARVPHSGLRLQLKPAS
jgi:hypothetical protein